MEIQKRTSHRPFSVNQTLVFTRKKKIGGQVCAGAAAKTCDVPFAQKERSFYSTLFLVKKRTGDLRQALDLKSLIRRIQVKSFKMESLQSILLAINTGDAVYQFIKCLSSRPHRKGREREAHLSVVLITQFTAQDTFHLQDVRRTPLCVKEIIILKDCLRVVCLLVCPCNLPSKGFLVLP